MISVLIPIYNYDVNQLVNEVHRQLIAASILFEIICFDDGSKKPFRDLNSPICELDNTSLVKSNKNLGRLKSREQLSKLAKYNWLLFMDADTVPKSKKFIINYLDCIAPKTEVVFGGFYYDTEPPDKTFSLRWKYGIKHEQVKAYIRNRNPYKLIISANFLINKKIFNRVNSYLVGLNTAYGHDAYFGALLQEHNIFVQHLDNEVHHLGLENNSVYLKKKEEASKTLLLLYRQNMIGKHSNSLLNLFSTISKFHLDKLTANLFVLFNKTLRSNLSGANPSIKFLQFYRILHLCYLANCKNI